MTNINVVVKTDVKKYSEAEVVAIHEEATLAASEAAKKLMGIYIDNYGCADRGCCGFAWVNIEDLRSNTKVAKVFAEVGFRRAYGLSNGIQLWNPSNAPVQNIDIKEVGADAYAEVLRKYNFKAYSGSRLD